MITELHTHAIGKIVSHGARRSENQSAYRAEHRRERQCGGRASQSHAGQAPGDTGEESNGACDGWHPVRCSGGGTRAARVLGVTVFRRRLEARGVATDGWFDEQMALCLLAITVTFGWEKAVGDEAELYRAFRGRMPGVEALLEQRGLKAA